MECGNIDTPPSRTNITIWGICEFVVMCIIGLLCFFGFFDILRYGSIGVWEIIGLVGNGFGIAGLIFVCLGLWQSNGSHFKIGILCFLVSILIDIVCAVFHFINNGLPLAGILRICLNIFLAYVLWRQSSHL